METQQRVWGIRCGPLGMGLAAIAAMQTAHAVQFDMGDSDIKIQWDNTVKYSTAWRIKGRSAALLGSAVGGNGIDYGANQDDGNRNFGRGLISSRLDWLSEFEAGTSRGGVRVSAAAWYDAAYNQANDGDSPATSNRFLARKPTDRFPEGTRTLHGRDSEWLDAFVWKKLDWAGLPATVRVGRHSLVYGETLFFGANGIADAQGPIDLVKLLSVPSSQFKEVLRPVEQISTNIQLTPSVSIGGYAQWKWQESRIPGVGSYLSVLDFVGNGNETFIAVPGAAGSAHTEDLKAKKSGQFGAQVRFSPGDGDWQFGLYAAKYHAKTPTAMYNEAFADLTAFVAPGAPAGTVIAPTTYRWVYAQDIRTYGVSASTSLGQLNLAAEMSLRRNAPLNSDPQPNVGIGPFGTGTGPGDNAANALYAVGNTGHLNISGIYVLQPSPLWGGGSLLAELGWNRTLSVTRNPVALDPNTTRDATAVRVIFSPAYFQVVSGLDLEIPIGVGYNISGRSSAIPNFNGGSSKAGDFSLGINGTYQTVWQFGLNYVHYFGTEGRYLRAVSSRSGAVLSFDQPLKDRNFLSFNLKRAF